MPRMPITIDPSSSDPPGSAGSPGSPGSAGSAKVPGGPVSVGDLQIPAGRTPGVYAKARWFDSGHLPSNQRQVATEMSRLAHKMITMLGDGDQLVLGLQHLIDAKDCFVRQSILDGENRAEGRLP